MNRRNFFGFLSALLLVPAIQTQAQETLLIRNGTVVPVVGDIIRNASILIKKGKIAQIGTDIVAPSDATIIDATGRYVYPGLVSPLTAIGLSGRPGMGNDLNELGVSSPQLDPYDAIDPEDDCIEVTRMGGVTTVLTVGGSGNVINGKSLAMNLEGGLVDEMVIKRYTAQIFNLGAKRENEYPTTLPGITALIRDKLNQATIYAQKKEGRLSKGISKDGKEGSEPFRQDLEMEALVPVVKGEVPALFITFDEVTVRNALQIIKEYRLKGILHATSDLLKFVDQLSREKIPVIWAGTMNYPRRGDPYDINYHTAAVLSAKGILFAFDQWNRQLWSHNIRHLPVPASMSVAHGLAEKEAIEAMTINPARILGIDDQVGSLEIGKTADLVIWTDSPIQMSSRVQTVIINGKVIPMTSIQTRLRDKYEPIVRERQTKKK